MMKYALEYVALKILLGGFWLLPTEMASNAGGALFRVLGPKMGISRVGRANIARAFPEWSQNQIEKTLHDMWDNLGRVIAEYPHLETIARTRTSFANASAFDRYGKGPTIFISGHLGNWEVLPPALLFQKNVIMHSAYRAPNNPFVDRLLVRMRSFKGRLRSFGKTRKGLNDILRALQNGENIGMLIDQKMNTGIAVPFFGADAMTSTAFVELARKIKCPLVPGRIVRVGSCRFDIRLDEPIEVGDRPTEDIVAQTHTIIERWIREQPAQWLWIHRRWKN